MDVTILCGGFGAARFVGGLAAVVDELTCVVNVGDDFEHLGLRVCPDLDSVLYALAGSFDESLGWGPVDDTFAVNAALGRYGEDWFRIGDADLSMSLHRTGMLRAGASLSTVTADLAQSWGVTARILPSSDQPAPTRIVTDEGELSFQEFVVRRQGGPCVREVIYANDPIVMPAPDVVERISSADVVIIAPSNPVSSIGPILALPGVRLALGRRPGPTVAVTPVVGSHHPRTGPAAGRWRLRESLMSSQGLRHRPDAVASCYRGLIDGFVLDEQDPVHEVTIEQQGLAVLLADTLAEPADDRERLARSVVGWAVTLPSDRRCSAG